MAVEDQAVVLFAGVRGFLDKLQTSEISKFEQMYLEAIRSKVPHIPAAIRQEGQINEKIEAELRSFLEDFMANSGLKMKA